MTIGGVDINLNVSKNWVLYGFVHFGTHFGTHQKSTQFDWTCEAVAMPYAKANQGEPRFKAKKIWRVTFRIHFQHIQLGNPVQCDIV